MACPSIAAPCVLLKPPLKLFILITGRGDDDGAGGHCVVARGDWRDSEATAKEIESLRRPLSYCSRRRRSGCEATARGNFAATSVLREGQLALCSDALFAAMSGLL